MNRAAFWKDYFEAVTLGCFGRLVPAARENPERFLKLIRGMRFRLLLHFLLLSIALNFPIMFAVSQLKPYSLYSRLYGDSFVIPGSVEDFNLLMYQNAYGRRIVLPILVMAFVLVLILQLVFYALAALCLGLQRLSLPYLSFRDRLGLLLFSSTGAACFAVLFGLWLPAVHIVVFYLAVSVIGFRRSRSCPNG